MPNDATVNAYTIWNTPTLPGVARTRKLTPTASNAATDPATGSAVLVARATRWYVAT